ncbi:flagellar brake protein [Paraneptunicella aestuarii]|uniref:flagellar brake domain-containing protein n=1 Tax=Paraneptunicella aestuarii TaxID=2831148 RepID=UPI001E59F28F|nr:PilZ domain-containing protein [Paraneptunicella aestuarii]UAA38322.1 flagellar brake protein [Paraneptunicella aestuarii]
MEAHKLNGEAYTLYLRDHLRAGQFVDIEIKTVKKRFHSKLIGLKESEYLIVELPDIRKYGYLKDEITDQASIVVRAIFEKTSGECIAFNSRALAKTTLPDKLLFISFPTDLISTELRKEVRETVDIKAFISHGDTIYESNDRKVEGRITNISPGGCHFEIPHERAMILKEKKVIVEFVPPGQDEAVKRFAFIRSLHKCEDLYALGLAFEEDEAPLFQSLGHNV